MKSWIVISFYTTGTGYEKEVVNLEKSLQEFKLPYYIFPCEPMGSWRKNLNYKSESILKAFEMFPDKDIVFLDADAIVRQKPVLFDRLSRENDFDLSAHFYRYSKASGGQNELLSGTLWIQNNSTGRALVRRWHGIGLSRPDLRHQMCLKLAIKELESEGKEVRVNQHPFEYTSIFDYHRARNGIKPIIEHFQASRRLRKEVGFGGNLISNINTSSPAEIERRKIKFRLEMAAKHKISQIDNINLVQRHFLQDEK